MRQEVRHFFTAPKKCSKCLQDRLIYYILCLLRIFIHILKVFTQNNKDKQTTIMIFLFDFESENLY